MGKDEVNHAGQKDWTNLHDRVADKWRAGTLEVLRTKNSELLEKLNNLENQIDSLLKIELDHKGMPKELRKEWRETLDKYEQVANCAIAYANRHLDADPNLSKQM